MGWFQILEPIDYSEQKSMASTICTGTVRFYYEQDFHFILNFQLIDFIARGIMGRRVLSLVWWF
jgi:hypothetical protein